jgi:hypothetical protein
MIAMCWWQLFFLLHLELVHDEVTSLCLFSNAIEQKVIDEETLLDLEGRHFEKLCLLEASFPPSFFDLMLHLTTHLAREIWFLGPCYLHQMIPYERFYGFLKSLVHNWLFFGGSHCLWLRDHRTSRVGHGLYGTTKPHWCALFTAWG